MEILITSDKQNELLSRREVAFTLNFNGATPSRKLVQAKLAAMVNAGKDQVVLDSMKSRFGISVLTGSARVYQSKEDLVKLERAYLMTRGGVAEEVFGAQDAPSEDAAEAS
ncbi:30S ribosomal protein S24e [Methanospirillum lacunae]|uniref:Small ribosomal subunit protein eS24 n=1 Tax=Methanospirillum lacunae TaxID=668570 RepID=A0A2V2MX17_9EURY|nr:30S ribosomal protein S24e [Methanospirillum lacunae]PWR71939.1 30S ribosomal protein S24e [Methanospirillum lacunae]